MPVSYAGPRCERPQAGVTGRVRSRYRPCEVRLVGYCEAMSTPEPADGLTRLEELISPDLHRNIDVASRAATVGWGLLFTVLHQVEAVLYLHRQGCCFAAAPNRRTAVEYAVCLVWLADQGDQVVDVLNRGLRNDQIQLANRLRAASLTERLPPDGYQILKDTVATKLKPEPDETLLHVSDLLDEYGYRALKAYYKLESRFVHVSLTAVQAFAREIEEQERLLLGQRPLYEELVPCQEFCLMVLFDAMLAFNKLLVGSPWTDVLTKIAADHDLPTQLPVRKGRQDRTR
jgi:hypothetical protein